jgi:hypothetical protein
LTLIFGGFVIGKIKGKIKKSQPSAAPTGIGRKNATVQPSTVKQQFARVCHQKNRRTPGNIG